ncbi:MAG: hypothetical protein HY791_25565 [Deltaproteobacteria bacterium]|nr:hypothetical protein [Deltaproteobacteria bacterium]
MTSLRVLRSNDLRALCSTRARPIFATSEFARSKSSSGPCPGMTIR